MASNDPFIDILTVIDAETLVSDYANNLGTKTSPTRVPLSGSNNASNYFYMLVKRIEANSMEAQPELSVAVKTSDNIRWRATSMTTNTNYSTLLNNMNVSTGAGLITPPAPYEAKVKVPTPVISGTNVTGVTTQPYVDFYYQSTAVAAGSVTYQLYFTLTDNQGKPVGYFYWDPYLTITQS